MWQMNTLMHERVSKEIIATETEDTLSKKERKIMKERKKEREREKERVRERKGERVR